MDSVAVRRYLEGTGAERCDLAGMILVYTNKAEKELKTKRRSC